MTDTLLTFPVSEGAARLGVSVDWYMRQLRARKLPGHKLGRTWRLTDEDLVEALRLTAQPVVVDPNPWGLAPGSLRRRRRGGPGA